MLFDHVTAQSPHKIWKMTNFKRSLIPDMILYKGWVKWKNPRAGKWHNRYLQLEDQSLVVYKNENSSSPESSYILVPGTQVEKIHGERFDRIIISIPGGAPLMATTSNSEEMDQWVKQIVQVIPRFNSFSIEAFRIISVIGRGFYGKVMLVQKNDTNELYALKTIHKSRLSHSPNEDSVTNERRILMQIEHPFIVKLCFAFQSSSKFYLGLEYMSGGELFYRIQNENTIPIPDCVIYMAELVLAFEYLHSKKIL